MILVAIRKTEELTLSKASYNPVNSGGLIFQRFQKEKKQYSTSTTLILGVLSIVYLVNCISIIKNSIQKVKNTRINFLIKTFNNWKDFMHGGNKLSNDITVFEEIRMRLV